MIIESEKDLIRNIELCIEVNREITGMNDNIRDSDTLESTFSSCIYYESTNLQVASIVCKLSQNQSFLDGNKRTSFSMLIYYSNKYNIKLKSFSQEKYAEIILRVANEHWTPEKLSNIVFY